jgi:hypothetical protein
MNNRMHKRNRSQELAVALLNCAEADIRKPVRWRPAFGLDHPDAPITPEEALETRKAKPNKVAKKATKV